jgi:hypothetical protein
LAALGFAAASRDCLQYVSFSACRAIEATLSDRVLQPAHVLHGLSAMLENKDKEIWMGRPFLFKRVRQVSVVLVLLLELNSY